MKEPSSDCCQAPACREGIWSCLAREADQNLPVGKEDMRLSWERFWDEGALQEDNAMLEELDAAWL